jgi:hypothetical protein
MLKEEGKNMLKFKCTAGFEVINPEHITNFYEDKSNSYRIKVYFIGGNCNYLNFGTIEEKNEAMELIRQSTQKSPDKSLPEKKDTNMLKELVQDVRSFVNEHRSTFYMLGVILLVDHFVFNGSFRERLKSLVEKMLMKVEDKINKVKE